MKKLARGITNFRKAVILLGAALFLPVAVAGCNTVAGLGADVEAAGDAIEDKAEARNTDPTVLALDRGGRAGCRQQTHGPVLRRIGDELGDSITMLDGHRRG